MHWYFDGRRIRTLANQYHQLYALPCTHEGSVFAFFCFFVSV